MTEQLETAYIQQRRSRYSKSEHDPLGDYLDEISKTPLLRPEEEVELAQMIETGVYAQHLLDSADDEMTEPVYDREELEWIATAGQHAQEQFYLANQRLVVNIAKRYSKRATAGHTLLDMIQDGNVGLDRAVKDFSFTEGNKFSTYAVWWIRNEISKGMLEKSRARRLPRLVLEKVVKVHRSEALLTPIIQREPTVADVADDLGRPYEEVARLKALGAYDISLNLNVFPEGQGECELGATIPEPGQSFDAIRTEKIRDGISHALHTALSQRDAKIIELKHGMHGREWSHEELAERYGLTPNGIETCLKRAFAKIRNNHSELLDLIH